MSNNQLPADTLERIKVDARNHADGEWGSLTLFTERSVERFHSNCEYDYIAGATAETERMQPVIDAAEKVAKLFAHKGEHQTCAICQLAKAIQQWKEGKEVGNG